MMAARAIALTNNQRYVAQHLSMSRTAIRSVGQRLISFIGHQEQEEDICIVTTGSKKLSS